MTTATATDFTPLTDTQTETLAGAISTFWKTPIEDSYVSDEVVRILNSDIPRADKHAAVLSKLRLTRGDRYETARFARVLMVIGGYSDVIDPDLIVA